MLSLHRLAESLWAKFWNRDLTGAECRSCEHAGKVRDVEDRSGVQIDPAFGVAHPVVEVVDISQDILMRYHDAFWPAGCAAGVNKAQDSVGVVKDLRNKIAINRKRFLVDHLFPVQLYSWDSEGGMTHDPVRTRIFENLVDLVD